MLSRLIIYPLVTGPEHSSLLASYTAGAAISALTAHHSQLLALPSQVPILLLGTKYIQWERKQTSRNLEK